MSAAEYIAFRQQGGVAHIRDRAVFRLTGADRVRYLNGQASANVASLGDSASLPACVTTAKGKLCGDVFVSSVPEALLIDADESLRESLLSRLERYIVSDDALLEDVSESLALLHVLPAQGAEASSLSPLPCSLEFASIRLSNRFGSTGIDIVLPSHEVGGVLASLAERFQLLTPGILEVLRIEAGIPRWGRELDADTLPHEARLDVTHIDYRKGCYIGQEVISRLKSVGHVNRRLMGFSPAAPTPGDSAEALIAGMEIFAPGDFSKPLGSITSGAFSFALAKPIALGYLKRGSPTNGLVARSAQTASNDPGRSGSNGTIEVVAQELPFIQ